MLLVLFNIGSARYGLSAEAITRIAPDAPLRPLPGAPTGVIGLLNTPEGPVPVVDLSLLTLGTRAPGRINTRILLARWLEQDASALIGLRVEHADDALRVEPGDFETTGIATPATPFLGPVVRHGTGFVQRIELGALLTPELQTCLRAAREVA